MGLAISRQFVQLMGGELRVESTVGKGSIFRFDIQVNQVKTAEVQAVASVEKDEHDQPSLTAADLAALSPELLADFRRAVKEVNLDRTNQIISQIHQENKILALALAELAENFRFDTLQTLVEEIDP